MSLRFVVAAVLLVFFFVACKQKERAREPQSFSSIDIIRQDYLSFIIALDTLPSAEIRKAIFREDSLLNSSAGKEANPFYYYFKARAFDLNNNKDSAVAWFEKMDTKGSPEIQLLKTYSIIQMNTVGNGIIEASWTRQALTATKQAEAIQSRQLFLFYDLLARIWFQNGHLKNATAYNKLYYKNHPFNQHFVVQQRFYDISFLLNAQEKDYKNMLLYNNKARELAQRTRDSSALARTYDNEAQLYALLGKNDKAVECSRKYFDFLKKSNNLNDVAYHNLGTSFMNNRQYDSAIEYYQQAIAFKKKENRLVPMYYESLIDAYEAKGDIDNALKAVLKAHTTQLKSMKEMDAVKMAELHEQYEAEKKDASIKALNSSNQLNQKIITQQRWILLSSILLFVGILSIFYIIYKQRLLKGKNKLLQSKNDRMRIEQKLLQSQLNPHFIFNAIANMSSLIASGNSKEAGQYLLSFSQLLRNILEQNRKDFIGLDEEISSLHNYLQLQQMRYMGLFEYKITTDENMDPTIILIPPMLLQPFTENAIEHGFKSITYPGMLSIRFSLNNKKLIITIEDNGTGLQEKKMQEPKHKQSLAQIILKERLAVLFTSDGQEAHYEIIDKKTLDSQGVMVQITLPEIEA